MVTGFYAAIATAASVFIGILTALLASNLSNRDTERSQILHRIQEIDSRLDGLDDQRKELEEQIEDVQWSLEKDDLEREATQRVRQFINEHVMEDFSPSVDDLDLDRVTKEFADYEGIEEKDVCGNEFLIDELEDRLHEIKHEAGVLDDTDKPFIHKTAEEIAAHQQMDVQHRIHLQDQYNQFQNRWHQTKTDIQALQNERTRLTPRYEALKAADADLLRPILWSIVLSVGIPLFVYFLRASGIVLLPKAPIWLETGVVSIFWVSGFVYVFSNLISELNKNVKDLPKEPDIPID